MMQSFLNVYSLQTGKIEYHKEYFILDDLVTDILETFQYTTDTHTITRVGKTPKKIYADKARIAQVITNLLTNAIKYSPDAEKVILTLQNKKDEVLVSIQDYGIGIPKEQQKMIFERFFRAKGKEENNIQGLGLGLYIAHEIVREHEGKMWVESDEGKGSTFYFTLPVNTKKD